MIYYFLGSCKLPGKKTSSVNLEAAIGTMTLQKMLFLPPSTAQVLDRPTSPIFAALQTQFKFSTALKIYFLYLFSTVYILNRFSGFRKLIYVYSTFLKFSKIIIGFVHL